MKRSAPLLAICLAAAMLTLAACSPSPFQPLPDEEVNQERKANAERIAFRLLSGWENDRYEPLTDDFTQEMKNALEPRAQRKAYTSIKAQMGAFESLEFVEAVASKNLPEMVLYRYRGTFSGTGKNPEIRVVMDERGRVSGFWCLEWHNTVK